MASDKHISLDEAKNPKTLKRFIKEHPSKGNEKQFNDLFNRMAKGKEAKKQDKSGS